MPQSSSLNRRVVLAARPQGEPADSDFRLETDAVPQPVPASCCCARSTCRLTPICAAA